MERSTDPTEVKSETEPGPDTDLDVLAGIMKGEIIESRKVGEMKLMKIVAKNEEGLFHNGIKIVAKTALVMVSGKSEPELLAGEYAHTINDDILNVMFSCINNPDHFRKYSNELFAAYEKLKKTNEDQDILVETPKSQNVPENRGDQITQGASEAREDLKDVLKPRF